LIVNLRATGRLTYAVNFRKKYRRGQHSLQECRKTTYSYRRVLGITKGGRNREEEGQELDRMPSAQNSGKNDLHESLQRERAAFYLRLENGAVKRRIEEVCEFLAVNRLRQFSAFDGRLQAVDD
jgi:hypothetical protein